MMLKKESTGDGDTGVAGGNNNWARVCDTCRAAACTVYCKADSAYLCSSCDSRIHAANRLASRHERVWVCEACENAPATFLCKADAASLCNACDASIHSANPLARRHQRVPILPISGDLNGAGRMNEELFGNMEEDGEEEEDETASWLLLNNDPVKKDNNNSNSVNQNNNFMFGGEVDEYLDLVEYNSNQYNIDDNEHYDDYGDNRNYGDESHVVPVQCEEEDGNHQYHNFQLGFDFESSKSGYSFNHGVPVSSMEVGMVSETAMDQEVSNKHMSRAPKGTIDLFSNHTTIIDQEMSNRDREAKVLRYREKKKNRKFEKTIRYASRKAYAETRPRIKGRFAKRSPTDSNLQEVDHLLADTAYGIVPAHAF